MSFGHQTRWFLSLLHWHLARKGLQGGFVLLEQSKILHSSMCLNFCSSYFCGGYIINIANAGRRSIDSFFIALSHPCYKVTYLISSLEQEASLQMVNSFVMPWNTQTCSDKLVEVKCSSAVSAFFIRDTHPCLYRVICTPSPVLEVEA